MDKNYDVWLIDQVKCRDTDDYVLLSRLAGTYLKIKKLRKVDSTTRVLALSFRDDYIAGMHVEFPNPENRYDGKVSFLEFMMALCYPYIYKVKPKDEDKENVMIKDDYGNNEIRPDIRRKRLELIFWPLIDIFKKEMDNALVLANMLDDFNEGKCRAFLAPKLPNIDKMPIRDQFAIFLHGKKIIKLEKKDIKKMIALTTQEEADDGDNYANPFNSWNINK